MKKFRERVAAELAAMHDRLGGDVKVDELREAAREWRTCRGGYGPFDVEVWTFRGREWRVLVATDMETPMVTPHEAWRQDPTMREWLHLTPGARKWVHSEWARLASDGD